MKANGALRNRSNGGIVGRIGASLFFLFFFAIGALFFLVIGHELLVSAQVRAWKSIECVILENHLGEDESGRGDPYQFLVRYHYEFQGRQHISTNWSQKNSKFSDYSKLERLAARYPADSKSTCFVNPSQPDQAVLEKPTLWIGVALLLPLFFITIGAGGLLVIWKIIPLGGPASQASPQGRGSRRMAPAVQWVFFSCFLLVGLGGLFLTTFQPISRIILARKWPATECKILSSHLRSHSGNKGTTYNVDILYAYQMNGREFRSNRYKFLGGSSSGQKGKAEIVHQYRPGSKANCFVNPQDPFEAVLERGFTSDMWIGILPGLFAFIGAAGLLANWRRRSRGIVYR